MSRNINRKIQLDYARSIQRREPKIVQARLRREWQTERIVVAVGRVMEDGLPLTEEQVTQVLAVVRGGTP